MASTPDLQDVIDQGDDPGGGEIEGAGAYPGGVKIEGAGANPGGGEIDKAGAISPQITNSHFIESIYQEHFSIISENRKLVRNNTRIDPSLDEPDIDGAIGHTVTNINIIESSEKEHCSMISENRNLVRNNTRIDPSLDVPDIDGAIGHTITNINIIESSEQKHFSMISEDEKHVTTNTEIAHDQADNPSLDEPGVEDSEDAGAGEAFAPASTIDDIIESIEQDCCCSMISEDKKCVANNNRTTIAQAEGQSDSNIEIDSEGAARKESSVTLINDNIESSEQDYSFSSMISEDWKFITEHTRIVVLPDPRLSSLLSQEDDISSTGTSDIQGEGLEELEYEYEPGIALGHMEFNASESLMQTSMNVSQCDSNIAMNESTNSMGGSMVTSTLSVHGATQGNLLRSIDNYFGVA